MLFEGKMKIVSFILLVSFLFLGTALNWIRVDAQPGMEPSVDRRRKTACDNDCLAGRCYFQDCQGKYLPDFFFLQVFMPFLKITSVPKAFLLNQFYEYLFLSYIFHDQKILTLIR